VNCNIEIGSVIGLGQSLVEVDMIRFLSLTPLFRGVICGARICQLFQQCHYFHEAPKP
jgi:hypothetical protein